MARPDLTPNAHTAAAPAADTAMPARRLGPTPSMRWRLEPRVLLDAAVPATLDALAALAPPGTDAHAADAASGEAAPRHELLVVDTGIEGWSTLVADTFGAATAQSLAVDGDPASHALQVSDGTRTLTLLLVRGDEDGLARLDRALAAAGTPYDAVHVLSHAERGALVLGSRTLDAGTLAAESARLGAWSGHLSAGADILLYGCDTAAGDAGVAFVRALAATTQADVAASDDPTGAAARGGDWALEVSTGSIETASVTGPHARAFEGLLAAGASTSVAVPAEELINESVQFQVTFDNTGADPGYAPFFDLVVPKGITGVTAGTAFAGGDVPLTLVGTWDATLGAWLDGSGAQVTAHPYGAALALPTGATTCDTWSIADLPFGSFTQDQPAVTTTFGGVLDKAAGALVGQGLVLTARGGFRYGQDPLDNPGTDAPLQQAAASSGTVTPDVLRFEKTNDRPEAEVATGPNEPITYTLRVNIATGETVSLARIVDQLPDTLQYIPGSLTVVVAPSDGSGNVTLVAGADGTLVAGEYDEPTGGAPQTGAAARLALNYGTLVGRAGDDIVVTYRAYVPEFDAAGAPVIDPANGTDADVTNTATTSATYDPDGAGALPAGTLTETQVDTLTAKPVAIQKGVSVVGGGRALPGATLEYTLAVQLSDYFSLDALVLDDRFSDGQAFDAGFTPTYTLRQGGATLATGFLGANVTVTRNLGTDGTTDLQFRLSDQLVADGEAARLAGDLFAADAALQGQTEVILTFRTVIEQDFVASPGDVSVDLGDVLTNDVLQHGTIVQADLSPGAAVDDDSAASVTIESIDAAKSVHAIDGDTHYASRRVGPGDTVTYRLRLELPSADVEHLVVGDYLPLPVFDVTEFDPDSNGLANILTLAPGALPAAGQIAFGPDQNLPPLFDDDGNPISLPTSVQLDAANNHFSIDFGSFDNPAAAPGAPYVIDLLYTVSATDRPFTDGLLLTNNATVALNNTVDTLPDISRIAQVQVSVPQLTLTKGVVATDGTPANTNESALGRGGVVFADPGAAGAAAFTGTIADAALDADPITTHLTGVDAGDLLTFAVVVRNTGSNDAFDVLIQDTLPADGLRVPPGGLNLKVTDGAGNPIAYVGDLFAGGIRLVDPDDTLSNETGALLGRTGTEAAGSNIVVITYDLEVSDAPAAGTVVIPTAALANAAEVLSFGGRNGGADFTAGAEGLWQDSASATIASPRIAKTLVGTSVVDAHNAANEATIGELVTYRVTLTLPEGTHPGLQVLDRLDAGLEFVGVTSVATSGPEIAAPAVGTTLGGSVATGRTVVFDLGDLANTGSSNGSAETVTLEYTVRVVDVAANVAGLQLNNRATLRENIDGLAGNGSERTFGSASAANVTLIEPTLDITKAVLAGARDAGTPLTYTVTVRNIAGTTGADAFDVLFADVLPAGVSGSAADVSVSAVHDDGGAAPVVSYDEGTRTVSAAPFDLAQGESVTITVTSRVAGGITAGADVTNTGGIGWSTLPGNDANERASYSDSASATFQAATPALAKTRVTTSIVDAHNAADQAVIGEEITYRLVVTVPEALLPVFTLRDLLDPGLHFVAIDSVSTSAGVTSASVADLNDLTLVRAATSVETLAGGQERVTIALGDVTNANDSDGAAETITIVYRARVQDVAPNVAGTTLGNAAEVRFDADGDGNAQGAGDLVASAAAPDTTVIEPVLTMQKDVSAPVRDAGSPVTYTITITNADGANRADAYDVVLADLLPAGLDGAAVNVAVSAVHNDGGTAPAVSYDEGTRTVSAAPFTLLRGESVTVTVHALIAAGQPVAGNVDNSAAIAFTSLPGASAGERAGAASDGAGFVLASPSIAKALVDTSNDTATNDDTKATVGELLTYEVTLTLPENTTPGVRVRDTLDAGLEFVAITAVNVAGGVSSDSVALDVAGVQAATSTSGSAATGQQVQIALGTLANANGSDGTPETVTLRYQVRVANVAAADAGATLNNGVALLLDLDGDGNSTDGAGSAAAAPIQVVEPALVIAKGVDDATASLGQIVTYTLTVRHPTPVGGTDTDAYDIRVRDSLPAGLTLVTGSVVVNGANVTADATAGNALDLTLDTLAPGAVATVTFSARVNDVVALAGSTQTNTAALTWSSLPGGVAGERDGSGGANDYAGSASVPLTVTAVDLAVSKSDGGITAVPGAVVPYAITYLNQGTEDATGVVLLEHLPAGTRFDAGAATPGWVDAGGGAYSFAVGNVNVGASGTVVFAVRLPAAVPAGLASITNVVSIDDDGSNGSDINPANDSGSDTTPLFAAPDYTVTKANTATGPVQPGDRVPFTLTVANLGNEDGTGVSIVDTFDPVLLQVDAGSLALPAGVTAMVDNTAGTMTFTVTNDALVGAGDSFAITYDARVAGSVPVGADTIAGSATVAGANETNLANNSDPDALPLLAAPDYTVTKANTATGPVQPGDVVPYTLTIANLGNEDGTGVSIVDSFDPTLLQVDAGSLALPPGVTAVVDNIAGTITFTVTDDALVGAGDGFAITYDARVAAAVPAGVVTIAGAATIAGANETNLANNSDPDALPLLAAPDYVAAKTSSAGGTANAGDAITYSILVRNDGNQDGTNVVVTDTLPTDLFDAPTAISAGGVYDADTGRITWTLPALAAGASTTLTFTAPLRADGIPADAEAVLNAVSVTDDGANGADPTPANNTAQAQDVLLASPDVGVTIDNGLTNVAPGDTPSFTVVVANDGVQDAADVVVRVTYDPTLLRVDEGAIDLPPGVTVTQPEPGVLLFDVGDLGSTAPPLTLNIPSTVLNAPAGAETSLVHAAVTAREDANPANDVASDLDVLDAAPDLRIDIADGIEVAQFGQTVTYTLNYANTGDQGATGGTVVLHFPPGSLEYVGSSLPGVVDAEAGTITVAVGDLPAGASGTLTIETRVSPTAPRDADGRLAVTATIADDGSNGADPTPANNTDRDDFLLVDDERDVSYFTDHARGEREHGITFGEPWRLAPQEDYPRYLHGRLISLETMQSDANLVGGRTEVKFDAQFGTWNHQFFPNPWNHERADFVKTQEWLDDFVNWLGTRAEQLADGVENASLDAQIDAAAHGDRGHLLRHLSKLAGQR